MALDDAADQPKTHGVMLAQSLISAQHTAWLLTRLGRSFGCTNMFLFLDVRLYGAQQCIGTGRAKM